VTLFTPCAGGSTFTDLSGAPLILVNALVTAGGVNTGRIDLAVPILAGATYACFYVNTKKTGNAGDVGNSFLLLFEDAATFNPFGFANWNVAAIPGFLGQDFGCTWVDISANPQPLGYQINNIGGALAVTTSISLYGYL